MEVPIRYSGTELFMPHDADSSLANILYGQRVPKEKRKGEKIHHVTDEMDLPKHKIENPLLFAKSREVLGNLISRRMMTSGGTDIDWLIEHCGGFMIFELKIFHDDRMIISKAQMSAYEKLHKELRKCRILFIGHDDIDFSDLNDEVWIFEMSEWKSRAIPHIESNSDDGASPTDWTRSFIVERDLMKKTDIKGLRHVIDCIWKDFES